MKTVWRADNRKTTYLDAGKYIAVRLSETTTRFFPWPEFSAKMIRAKLMEKNNRK